MWSGPKETFHVFFFTYCLIWLITLICVCMCASTCMWALDQRWHCILPTSLILCSSGTSTLRPAPVFLITVVIKGTDRGARSLLTYFLTSLPTDLSAGGWTTCWRRRAPEGAAFISRAEVWGGGVEKTHLIWDGFPPVLQGFFFFFPNKIFWREVGPTLVWALRNPEELVVADERIREIATVTLRY